MDLPVKNFFKYFLAIALVLTVVIVAVKIRNAGFSRQARLNVAILGRVLSQYHEKYNDYPADRDHFPSFRAASAVDRVYFDSAIFKKKQYNGYKYDFTRSNASLFVVSASPVGLLSAGCEFAITEDGVVRKNCQRTDGSADSYQEVRKWPGIKTTAKE